MFYFSTDLWWGVHMRLDSINTDFSGDSCDPLAHFRQLL